jgi:hypothetical protein
VAELEQIPWAGQAHRKHTQFVLNRIIQLDISHQSIFLLFYWLLLFAKLKNQFANKKSYVLSNLYQRFIAKKNECTWAGQNREKQCLDSVAASLAGCHASGKWLRTAAWSLCLL